MCCIDKSSKFSFIEEIFYSQISYELNLNIQKSKPFWDLKLKFISM